MLTNNYTVYHTCLALPTQNETWSKQTNLPLSGCINTQFTKSTELKFSLITDTWSSGQSEQNNYQGFSLHRLGHQADASMQEHARIGRLCLCSLKPLTKVKLRSENNIVKFVNSVRLGANGFRFRFQLPSEPTTNAQNWPYTIHLVMMTSPAASRWTAALSRDENGTMACSWKYSNWLTLE